MNPSKLFLQLTASLLVLASTSTAIPADPAPDRDAAILGRLIGETTLVIVKVDPTQVALPDLVPAANPSEPAAEASHRQRPLIAEAIETFRAATGGQPFYLSIGIPRPKMEWPGIGNPLLQTQWPVLFFLPQSPKVDKHRLQEYLRAFGVELTLMVLVSRNDSVVHNGMIVMAPDGIIDLSRKKPLDVFAGSPREGLDEAFASVASYPIQILLVPPDYIRRTVVELMPQLPRHLGGGSSDVLTEGLRWAALGLDPGGPRATLVVQSASPQAAQRLADRLPEMLQSVYDELPGFQQCVGRLTFAAWVALLTPAVEDDRIVFRIGEDQPLPAHLQVLVAEIMGSIEDRLRGHDRCDSANRFKRILLAMHNYHDVYKMLPPRDEVRDEQGRSGLSWRVHLLPFLRQQNLYDEFRLDERWDSPHNKPLMEKMPEVYQSRWIDVAPGHTTFLAPVGEDTVLGGEKGTRFADIGDGASNTVVLVEVKPELAVPWTAPEDYAFDPESPGDGLWLDSDGRCLIGMADGSVHHARGDIPPSMLLRLFQKSDGHLVDWKLIR
jgi:hypothetical protein